MDDALPIRFGTQVCGTLDEAATREWLVTDGCGGYAMGTVAGLRSRRYHGLLLVADPLPVRRLALASLDAVLVLPSGARVSLAVHEWAGGAVSPRGHELLASFDLDDGVPRWRWRVGDVVVEREVAMRHGASGVGVVHRLVAGGPVTLELEALTTWRDGHGERFGDGDLRCAHDAGGVSVEDSYRVTGPGWQPGGGWYRGVHARAEADRGLNPNEDLWFAGRFVAELSAPGAVAEVSAWAGDVSAAPPPAREVVAAARARAKELVRRAGAADPVEARLALAADQFVVSGPDVVAGYPWFGAWSRDTMTSYEGLFLETGREDEGAALLHRYAGTVSDGMLANTADTGTLEYNTADGTLWFAHAIGRHVTRTGDTDLADALAPVVDDVVKHHLAGTRYGIRIDDDGLLTQGEPGYALTWMDARVDGIGITPRIGKAVELNALWVRALSVLAELRRLSGRDSDEELERLHRSARASFARRFPAPGGGLYDVVDGPSGDDAAVRPNQLLAMSLPDPLVVDPGAVRHVAASLLTPVGLRSLAPDDPGYRGHHRGGPRERDAAYHAGTVWPWLLGPYVDAAVAAGVPVVGVIDAIAAHLGEWGLGSLSETADGDAPHGGTGCPFQAWSVAEALRAVRRARQ